MQVVRKEAEAAEARSVKLSLPSRRARTWNRLRIKDPAATRTASCTDQLGAAANSRPSPLCPPPPRARAVMVPHPMATSSAKYKACAGRRDPRRTATGKLTDEGDEARSSSLIVGRESGAYACGAGVVRCWWRSSPTEEIFRAGELSETCLYCHIRLERRFSRDWQRANRVEELEREGERRRRGARSGWLADTHITSHHFNFFLRISISFIPRIPRLGYGRRPGFFLNNFCIQFTQASAWAKEGESAEVASRNENEDSQ